MPVVGIDHGKYLNRTLGVLGLPPFVFRCSPDDRDNTFNGSIDLVYEFPMDNIPRFRLIKIESSSSETEAENRTVKQALAFLTTHHLLEYRDFSSYKMDKQERGKSVVNDCVADVAARVPLKVVKIEAKDILADVIQCANMPTPLVKECIDLLGPGDGVRGFGCEITIFVELDGVQTTEFSCQSFSSSHAKEAEEDACLQCLEKLEEDYRFEIDDINYYEEKEKIFVGGTSGTKQQTDSELLVVRQNEVVENLEKEILKEQQELTHLRSMLSHVRNMQKLDQALENFSAKLEYRKKNLLMI